MAQAKLSTLLGAEANLGKIGDTNPRVGEVSATLAVSQGREGGWPHGGSCAQGQHGRKKRAGPVGTARALWLPVTWRTAVCLSSLGISSSRPISVPA